MLNRGNRFLKFLIFAIVLFFPSFFVVFFVFAQARSRQDKKKTGEGRKNIYRNADRDRGKENEKKEEGTHTFPLSYFHDTGLLTKHANPVLQ